MSENTHITPGGFCPLLVLAHAMPGGPRGVVCSPDCAWYTTGGCAVAHLANNAERIADRKEAQ